jgi:acyl-CoA synthetase (AMP-forming)/AMP-acid ligase II
MEQIETDSGQEANKTNSVRPGGLSHTLSELFEHLHPDVRHATRIFDTKGAAVSEEGVKAKREQLQENDIGYRDRVLVSSDAGIVSVEWFIAVWSLGAVLIPVDIQVSEETLQNIVEDSQAIALCHSSTGKISKFASGLRESGKFLFEQAARVTGVDLALIIYTSGSTGKPKGIMLTHTNVLTALRAISTYLELNSGDVILAIPPLHFDYGLYQVLFAFHANCTTVLSIGTFSPTALVAAIERFHPTVVPVVPAIGQIVAKTLAAFKRAAQSVRLVTNTGGHLPIGTINALHAAFPNAAVMPMYGLTESKRALFLSIDETERRPGSVGKPMPGLDARVFIEVVRPDGRIVYQEARAGQVGMLYVRGSSVMQGYVNDASGAGARLIGGDYRDDNWLSTGDLFYTDEDGFLYFHGRDKDLIKQAGYCLYPREIEQCVERCEDVIAAIVIGGTDAGGDEIAELFVQLQPGCTIAALQTWIDAHLDRTIRPRRMQLIENWPLTPNGKIDRKQLRQDSIQSAASGKAQV